MRLALFCALFLCFVKADAQQPGNFAEVKLAPRLAVVTLAKGIQADQVIITVFYRTTRTIGGKPVSLLLTVRDMIPAIPGTAVAADSVLDPSSVEKVRLELVRNVGRMDWGITRGEQEQEQGQKAGQ